jgi:hypothetical protein
MTTGAVIADEPYACRSGRDARQAIVEPVCSHLGKRCGTGVRAVRVYAFNQLGVNAMAKRPSDKSARVTKGSAAKPVLLAGENPQIGKADGDAPVQAYIAAMPGWKGDIGRRLDTLIVHNVPDVRKAVRWNSPFYGITGQGWFLGIHTFTNYVKVTFFRGASIRPVPPGGTANDARWINIYEHDLDEAQMAAWVKQAAALPGWGKS